MTHTNSIKKLSFMAVVYGVSVAIGLLFLLSLFGIAIGISTFTLNTDGKIIIALGGTAAIGLGIGLSMLAAGYTAGYLGEESYPESNLGLLYGFVTWSFTVILSALLIMPLTNYATTFSNAISRSIFIIPQESTNTSEPTTVEATPTLTEDNHKSIKVLASPESLALSSFLLFIIFLIGAVASCLGGHWAADYRSKYK